MHFYLIPRVLYYVMIKNMYKLPLVFILISDCKTMAGAAALRGKGEGKGRREPLFILVFFSVSFRVLSVKRVIAVLFLIYTSEVNGEARLEVCLC